MRGPKLRIILTIEYALNADRAEVAFSARIE